MNEHSFIIGAKMKQNKNKIKEDKQNVKQMFEKLLKEVLL